MRYEWKNFERDINGIEVQFLNDPNGCTVIAGRILPTSHAGLNLTPEGEWVAAPGLNPDPTVENLRQTIAGLSMQVNELRERHDAGRDFMCEVSIFLSDCEGRDSATMAIIKDIYDKCRKAAGDGKLPREPMVVPTPENGKTSDGDTMDRIQARFDAHESFLQDKIEERDAIIAGKHERLAAIEQWATKPCVDVKLRLAQAHVLKMVRGEV